MYMNIALIFAIETKWWGNYMFVAFLFRVNLIFLDIILYECKMLNSLLNCFTEG